MPQFTFLSLRFTVRLSPCITQKQPAHFVRYLVVTERKGNKTGQGRRRSNRKRRETVKDPIYREQIGVMQGPIL